MADTDRIIRWKPTGGYVPTAPYGGASADTVFRGENLIVRGQGSAVYLEGWQGNEQFTEVSPPVNVALTGTVAIAANSPTLTGTGTKFTQELIPGQWILVNDDIWNVLYIDSDTSLTISEDFTATASGLTGYRTQIVFEVDNARGNLIRGNAIRFANGNILTVGDGDLRLNGDTLTGSVSASKRLVLAIIDAATSTSLNTGYTSFPLGMATPTLSTLTAVGGGTVNMQAGTYSVRIVPERIATGGYNNPSEKVEVTLAAGQQIQITFPAMDTASGQDAWGVYVSLFSTGGGIQGPWYYYGQITTSQVSSAGGTFTIEYNDADVSGNRLLTFDNDPPPDAIFVATLQGLPILISCNGKGRLLQGTVATASSSGAVVGTGTAFLTDCNRGQLIYIDGKLRTVEDITDDLNMTVSPDATATASGLAISLADTAPGPVLRPAKPAINGNNVEAFPANFKVAVDPPENIVAWCRGAQGRIFVGTENYVHLASSTGNPDLPVTVRPFWRTGVRNTNALLFVNDTLYAYTTNGPTRSVGDGDETIQEHSFAAPVQVDFAGWQPERVRVGYDPKNEAVCFFHSGQGVTLETGFRGTDCLMYMLRLGVWSTLIKIRDDAADALVTGVATVAGQLVLTISGANYLWDSGNNPIQTYAATPFLDADDPGTDKTVTGMQITGYSSINIQGGVWAASAGEEIPASDLALDINPDSGTLSFFSLPVLASSFLQRTNVPRARLFASRVNLTWLGTGRLPRLDEIVIRGNLTDRRY